MICILIYVQFPSLPIFTEWKYLVHAVKKCKPLLKVIPIKWIKPSDGSLKLNTNGCGKRNPRLAGGGGCLRNQYGDLIMANSTFFGSYINDMADARAILVGLIWCIDNGYKEVEIESDPLIIINAINNQAGTP
ncbi:hypothetical protein A4A49_54494 [Nicotiana attenuata]|uniref:RNase H type-1 domain-containing protein n=1 Tax=Nicotiana attenuata TaxID=49451 RepID=A0A1J6K2F2_NICAT|nr:hypothetical protein A4A49_54494 [Nicotiana attenuata]